MRSALRTIILSIPATALAFAQTAVISSRPMIGPQSVTGRPWSGEETVERVQTLADGTHITSPEQITRFWRDSAGRTRTERVMTPALPGPQSEHQLTMVDISDPVAGYRYSYTTADKIARRFSIEAPPGARDLNRLLPIHPTPGRVPAGRLTPAQTMVHAPNQIAASASMPRPEIKEESLGSNNIEGVVATGSRTTTIHPVGAFGNDRPITVVRETWTSPDLDRPVLVKVTDPRAGDVTTKLTNISRSEPDSSLFQPPAGYEIKDPGSN